MLRPFLRVFSCNVFNFYDVLVLLFGFTFCRTSGALFKVLGVAIIGSLILHLYDYNRRRRSNIQSFAQDDELADLSA